MADRLAKTRLQLAISARRNEDGLRFLLQQFENFAEATDWLRRAGPLYIPGQNEIDLMDKNLYTDWKYVDGLLRRAEARRSESQPSGG